ncbi:hypothetical protein [Mycobacterium leprae]|uniref:hypothetical protein n=1 Tax=Mycobacterium leprae TaxID=1769 RepID=UPI000ADB06E1|nr:hypothetical protein [Mycobacterium leprae]
MNLGVPLARADSCGDPESFTLFRPADGATIDKLDRFPSRIVPFGYAVAKLQPHPFGARNDDGVAAGQVHLQRELESRNGELARVLCSATSKTTYLVWAMNTIADLCFYLTSGHTHLCLTDRSAGWLTSFSEPPRPIPFSPNRFCTDSPPFLTACT